MSKKLERYLLEAVGKQKQEIAADNLYREIAFDGDKERLGWVKPLPFSRIKESLEKISDVLEGKENFIFVGMGGSINGIKPLIALFGNKSFSTLDNLDPNALARLLEELKNSDKTLVITISKSGTTKETQLLAAALREFFASKYDNTQWPKHFLWLSDPESFVKIDSYGWSQVKKTPIQFDGKTDIGGRFSSPHTLIFILPLFLLLKRNLGALEKIYSSFVSLQKEVNQRACSLCEKSKNKKDAYFSPLVDGKSSRALSSWIVQLFQESLGSKLEGLAVKTITGQKHDRVFFPLRLGLEMGEEVVSLMSQMYFFQVFIAYYAACHRINFVSQEFVEKYKNQMRELESQASQKEPIESIDIEEVLEQVKRRITPEQKFIEIVLYFYPAPELIDRIKKMFARKFSQKKILVFVGSDWNHQSYQAAFGSKDTFYVLLALSSYTQQVEGVSNNTLLQNIETLQVIAKATYLTLKDKSLLFSLK